MDQRRVTTVLHTLTGPPSRRDMLRALGGAGLGLVLGRWPRAATARKRRRKAVRVNEFGCVDAGKLCKTDAQCCSSVCRGKKGRRRCRAHHTGTCPQSSPGQCLDPLPVEAGCNGLSGCGCWGTTAGSTACVTDIPSGVEFCTDCTTDADCEAIGFPAGSVCVPRHLGGCAGSCPSNRSCMPPCGADYPTSIE